MVVASVFANSRLIPEASPPNTPPEKVVVIWSETRVCPVARSDR